MSTEAALRAAIEASPHDEAARQVYADWLLEQGDPRGRLLVTQLARHHDPLWAHPRLEREEARLYRDSSPVQTSWLFDRGEEGLAVDVRNLEPLDARTPGWLRPFWPLYTPRKGISAEAFAAFVEALRAHPALAGIYRLDLSRLAIDPWPLLLTSSARPRRVHLPHDAGTRVEELLDAPLLSEVEHITLDATFDDAAVARLATAPWAQRLTTIVVSPNRITNSAFGALACLPRLARLDVRGNAITAAAIALLEAGKPPLVELELSIDALGTEGLAALERSTYAGVARVSIAGPRLTSADAVAALTRSPCWNGILDLEGVPRWNNNVELRLVPEIVEALAREPAGKLVGARVAWLGDAFDAFVRSPIVKTLRHLGVSYPGSLAGSEMRLDTLRIWECQPYALRPMLHAPAAAELRGLSLHGAKPPLIATLADAPIRPLDLELVGTSATDPMCALARSPVLERVVDLTLAVRGNHASAPVTAAFVETPYLQDIQRLELAFLASFPGAKRGRLMARFGAALR